MSNSRYRGILAERIYLSVLDSADPSLHAAYKQSCEERDLALFACFGIDPNAPDAWRELAFSLAEAHVPAFCSRNAGRPPVNQAENLMIAMEFQLLVRADGLTDAEAYRRIAERRNLPVSTVKERMKEFMRSPAKYLVTILDRFEKAVGRETLLDSLRSSLIEDPEWTTFVEDRVRRLRRPPYQ